MTPTITIPREMLERLLARAINDSLGGCDGSQPNCDTCELIRQTQAALTAASDTVAEKTGSVSDEGLSDDENLRLKALVTVLSEACVIQDSYGVQGSEFSQCLVCGAGGAPGIAFKHTPECAVGRAEATAERYYKEYTDEIAEYEEEEKHLRARIKELEAAHPAPDTERAGVEERIALWMIAHSYVTGHGDTIEDLLGELEAQIKARSLSPVDSGAAGAFDLNDPRRAASLKDKIMGIHDDTMLALKEGT